MQPYRHCASFSSVLSDLWTFNNLHQACGTENYTDKRKYRDIPPRFGIKVRSSQPSFAAAIARELSGAHPLTKLLAIQVLYIFTSHRSNSQPWNPNI